MNLSDVNEKQKQAVLAEGIVRVIAGAGSGKTRVLVFRIGHLIAGLGIHPSNILAVTFTRKAAREMKSRLRKLIGKDIELLNTGTFHSICYRILNETLSNGKPFRVMNDKERNIYLKKVIGSEGMNLDMEAGKVGSIISLAKNRLIDADGFSREANDHFSRNVSLVFKRYDQWKTRDRLLDYDDLLLRCWQILKTDKAVLTRYSRKFSHILVDEFQDTNHAQFEIIKILTPPQNNFFVVGDDWQSIYGWRGAVPENILEFDQVFPDAITIKLERNYRSTGAIVDQSNRLISFNRVRTEKQLWTKKDHGREIEILTAENTDEEASAILRQVQSLVGSNGFPYKDISVLYRTNAQSRPFEDECIRMKIPYRVVGAPGFYDRREVRDMIAYLSLIHNTDDDEALQRIINVPSRYLGRAFMQELEKAARYRHNSLFESLSGYFSRAYMKRNAAQFRELIIDLRNYYIRRKPSLSELLLKVRKFAEYDRYICEDEEASPDDSRIQNLNELGSALKRFDKIEDFLAYLERIKTKTREDDRADKVNLMTLHKSKGLEFPVVFIAGCGEGLFPHHKAVEDGDIDEERRLCYVGMTRAMEILFFSYPKNYQGKMKPSRFLKEAFSMEKHKSNNKKSTVSHRERGGAEIF